MSNTLDAIATLPKEALKAYEARECFLFVCLSVCLFVCLSGYLAFVIDVRERTSPEESEA